MSPKLPLRLLARLRTARARSAIVLLLATMGLWILLLPSIIQERSAQRELESLRKKWADLQALSREYVYWKDRLKDMEERLALSPSVGIGAALDGVFSSLGLRSNLKSLKMLGSRDISEAWGQEIVVVQIDKLTLNQLINLLHRLRENKTLLLKRATIRRAWDDSELLEMTLTVSLVTKKR